jgi:hypothetical protein
MRDPIDPILCALADPALRFGTEELDEWEPAFLAWLQERGIVTDAGPAETLPCPSCGGSHLLHRRTQVKADVEASSQSWIICPEAGWFEVDDLALTRMRFDRAAFAKLVANALGLLPPFREALPGRYWTLGSVTWGTGMRQVALALGLTASDGPMVAQHAGRSGRQILLVERSPPGDMPWPGRVPVCVPLEDLMAWTGAVLAIESMSLRSLVEDLDHAADAEGTGGGAEASRFRRRVKQAVDSMATADALVQAYVTHGSYRAAANALNQSGFATDRWAVERAVKAAGGLDALRRMTDSDSVARTVASQPRDRATKLAQRR